MDTGRAVDDLKAIRQIMERTRRATDAHGGWFMVLWGAIWFVGFPGSQFLPEQISGWVWLGLDVVGMAGSVWLGARMSRRGTAHSPLWRPMAYWMVAVIVFDFLLIWLLGLDTPREGSMVFLLTIALSYFQFGIFSTWKVSAVGAGIGALTVLATVLLPDFFFLAMAILGGGLLAGSGIWLVKHGG